MSKIEKELKYGQNPNYVRPNWDDYFIEMMQVVAHRATCDRGRAGCVIVRDNHTLSTGYVGAPPGLPSCDEVGHLIKVEYDEKGEQRQRCIRTAHAEANAIAHAARHGISLKGATLYCKMEPCFEICTKLIISAGIVKVVAQKKYHAAQYSREFLAAAGVELIVLENEFAAYK